MALVSWWKSAVAVSGLLGVVWAGSQLRPANRSLPRSQEAAKKGQKFIPPPGHFIPCSFGTVHYQLRGPEDGEKVVFVHGFGGQATGWEYQASGLAAKGYRVLTYDHYGCAWSEGITSQYSMGAFTSQLAELLFHLGWQQIHLIGASMGGAISGAFADMYPDKITSLSLIASAGFPVLKPLIARVNGLPYIGEILFSVFGRSVLLGRVARGFSPRPDKYPKKIQQGKERIEHLIENNPDWVPSLLEILRDFPMGEIGHIFHHLGSSTSFPVLILWGDTDLTVPTKNTDLFKKAIPRADIRIIKEAGHLVERQYPELIEEHLYQQIAKFPQK